MDFYPYPPAASARIDPFDAGRAAVQYVVFGGERSTYAFTERLEPANFFLAEWIPLGYKVLQYAQKAAVYKDGTLVREWPQVEAGPRRERPEQVPGVKRKTRPLASSWQISACGYLVAVPSGERTRIGYDREEAMEAGALASLGSGAAAVWFVYAVENWH
ncbi:hypothetical protein ACFQS3_07200 [Glycomyces mayteni]|uniref:Uncharacterized protein n=1 Tax=Glycomyces mayteni TaxID=543887 RepID=A0ABW2D3W2_9ACTN|nr:hypothetical protein GCM10025732_23400 [Glycomyces mayteni]